MEINIRDKEKIVEIWLAKNKTIDRELRESLMPLYREYKGKKYTVAVFESGGGELYGNVESLVLHNLKL